MADWTPTALSGLTVWYDASTLSEADDTGLASFPDLSGNARHATQGTAGNQPLVKTEILNGLRVVRFDGTDDYMDMGTSLGMDTQPFSYAAIFNRTRVGIGNSDLWTGKTLENGAFQTSGENYAYISGEESGYVLYDVTDDESMNIHTGIFNEESSHASINGVLWDTIEDGIFGTAALPGGAYLGTARIPVSDWMMGDLAELFFSATAWSTATREKAEGYLAHKWALTTLLPAEHPYKSEAPQDAPVRKTGLRFAIGDGLRQRTLR